MLLALVLSAALGQGEFEVDQGNATASYQQDAQSLTLIPPVTPGATLGGAFRGSALDWSSAREIFLLAAVDGENPLARFTLEFYEVFEGGARLINSYTGSTVGTSSAFGLIKLELQALGSGDFSSLQGLQFTWEGLAEGEGGLIIRSVVGSAGPIVPVVTSTSYVDGDFTLTWSGTGALPVVVERRESLETGQWTAIAQGVATGEYTDTDPPEGAAFYRVVVP